MQALYSEQRLGRTDACRCKSVRRRWISSGSALRRVISLNSGKDARERCSCTFNNFWSVEFPRHLKFCDKNAREHYAELRLVNWSSRATALKHSSFTYDFLLQLLLLLTKPGWWRRWSIDSAAEVHDVATTANYPLHVALAVMHSAFWLPKMSRIMVKLCVVFVAFLIVGGLCMATGLFLILIMVTSSSVTRAWIPLYFADSFFFFFSLTALS